MRKSVSECISVGKYEEAMQTCLQLIDKVRKYYGTIHPASFSALNNLALIFKIIGNYEEAKEIYERVVQGYTKIFGKEHNSTLTVM